MIKPMALVVTMAAFLNGCGEAQLQEPTMTVKIQDFQIVVWAEGALRAVNATPINAPSTVRGGMVIGWIAPEGRVVSKGDILVKFDETDLLVSEFETRNDLSALDSDAAVTMRRNRELGLKLSGEMNLTRQELDQADTFALSDEDLYSREEIIESESSIKFLNTKVRLLGNRSRRHDKKSSTENQLLDLQKKGKQLKLDQVLMQKAVLSIKAPHEGAFYYKRNWRNEAVQVGQTIWPGRAIGVLPDLDLMEAKVFVLERDAAGLKTGLAAEVEIDSRPGYHYVARVKTVAALAKAIERQSPIKYFEVILSLETTDPKLMKPGSYANARVFIEKREQVIAVPNQVLYHDENQHWVYLLQNNKPVKTRIRLGSRGPTQTIVTDGLKPGNRICLSAPDGGR